MPYIGQSLTEGTRREYSYVAASGQTVFPAIYTVGAVDVHQNGILLPPSDYTATDGTTVVFDTGCAVNDEVVIHCHNTFSVADTYRKADTYTKTEADTKFVDAAGDTLTGDLTAPNNIISGYRLDAGLATDSAGDVGISVYHGTNNTGYGRIRFYEGAAQVNGNTIHSFGLGWQGGSFSAASAGALNIAGTNGVTIGDWNNPALLAGSGTSGQVYTPHVPVFWAYNSGGTVTSSTGFVTFASTDVNNGGHYNTSNGRFTVPVSGYYEFDGMLLHRTNGYSGSAEWSFAVNGANVSTRGMAYSSAAVASGHIPAYSSMRRWLSAGDYVQMYVYSLSSGHDYYTGERLAHFSGKFIG